MQIIHGLVDRIMEKNGVSFVSPGDRSGYYIERSDVSVNDISVLSVCLCFCSFLFTAYLFFF